MNATSNRSNLVALSLVLTGALGLAGCAEFFASSRASEPTAEASPSTTSAPAASSLEAAAELTPAAAETEPEATKGPTKVSLDTYGLPLSIELPANTSHSAETIDPSGGTKIGSMMSDGIYVHVFKAGPSIKSIAAAKSRKRVPGCDAQPVVKEGPDHYIYNCKMRSMESLQLLMLKEVNGVVYACESLTVPKKVEELDAQLAACRTIASL